MADEKDIKLKVEDELGDISHYGTPRHSGRYPWGSGKILKEVETSYRDVRILKAKDLVRLKSQEHCLARKLQLKTCVTV